MPLTFSFSLISFVDFVRTKYKFASNHQKENTLHDCSEQCQYNNELDNEIITYLRCDREGHNTTVYGKLITSSDNLVEEIVKYVWSGFVIECPKYDEIYRSRKYWYGNNEPKDVTHVEVIHIWPLDDTSRLPSDVTRRKVVEVIRTTGRFV